MFPIGYSAAFVLAAGLSILMLITDRNLQTGFGAVSSGYYSHWYAVLALAVTALVGAALLLAFRSRPAVKLGVVGSGLSALLLLAVVFTYQQVGFASAGDFANYLFGVTYSGGDIRYLYDALLTTYLETFAAGAVSLALRQEVSVYQPRTDLGTTSRVGEDAAGRQVILAEEREGAAP